MTYEPKDCCLGKLDCEILVCPSCKEWTEVLSPCCGIPEPNLCQECYKIWIDE